MTASVLQCAFPSVATAAAFSMFVGMLEGSMSSDRTDAAINDIPGMEYAFLKMKDLAFRAHVRTGEQYAPMMARSHPLPGKANDAVTSMKKTGGQADPSHAV